MHYVLTLLAALLLGPAVALPGHLQFMRGPIPRDHVPQHTAMTHSIPRNTLIRLPPSLTGSPHTGISPPTASCPPQQTVTVTVTVTQSGTGLIPSPSQPPQTSLQPTAPRPPPTTLTTSPAGPGTGTGVPRPPTFVGGTGVGPPGTISPMSTGTRTYVRPTLSVPYPVYF